MPPALGKRGRPEGGDGGGGGGGRTPGPAGLPAAAAEVEELNRQFLAWVEARVRGPGAAPGAPLGAGCRAYLCHLAALQPAAVRPPTEPEIPARGGVGSGGWRARTPTRSSAPSRGPPNAGPSKPPPGRRRWRPRPPLPDGPVGPSTCSGGARADSARLRFAANDCRLTGRRPDSAQAAGGDAAGMAFVFGCGDMGQVRPIRRRRVGGTPDFTD